MVFPKIKFKIDPKKDVSTFFSFLSESRYDSGRNFNLAILKKYNYFKKFIKNVKKDIVSDFVLNKYIQEERENKKRIILIEKNWKKIEKRFFKLTTKLFPNVSWPKGKYVAYSTIWGMYPRFLSDKTFQIPLDSSEASKVNFIIAHEMLHFLFYKYFLNRYKKYRIHKYDFFVWHVSEIFNVVVMNDVNWQKIIQYKDKGYPEHRKIIKSIKTPIKDVDRLIDEIIFNLNKYDNLG